MASSSTFNYAPVPIISIIREAAFVQHLVQILSLMQRAGGLSTHGNLLEEDLFWNNHFGKFHSADKPSAKSMLSQFDIRLAMISILYMGLTFSYASNLSLKS